MSRESKCTEYINLSRELFKSNGQNSTCFFCESEKMMAGNQDLIDRVRHFFTNCHAPSSCLLLEEECQRVESRIREEEPDEVERFMFPSRSIEATKRYAASYAALIGTSILVLPLRWCSNAKAGRHVKIGR